MTEGELSTKQKAAIAALLAGASNTEAAAAAGVHPNRIGEWMHLPGFVAYLREAEKEALSAVSRKLIALCDKSIGTLEHTLDNEKAKDRDRIRAANIVLARLLQLRALADLDERVRKLEEERYEQSE